MVAQIYGIYRNCQYFFKYIFNYTLMIYVYLSKKRLHKVNYFLLYD
jgi:hypothetical protein